MSNIKLPPSGLAEEILPEFEETQKELQIVTFSLDEEYGVPITQVQEIIRVGNITRVPNSPHYMEGVINLRGRILPVLNLRKRLGLPEKELTKSSRIIVTEIGDKVIGLLVDAVSHVIKLPLGTVEPAPDEVLDIDTDYITGVGKLSNRIIIILDLERLLKKNSKEIYKLDDNLKEDGAENI
jgi:purine-binding chemotaxis protein CheW